MKNNKDFPLMAFTFFYAVAIYTMCIGFYYWDKHSDKKTGK